MYPQRIDPLCLQFFKRNWLKIVICCDLCDYVILFCVNVFQGLKVVVG